MTPPQPPPIYALSFQWDEEKRRANLEKHGLDFRDAGRIMRGPVFHRMSPRGTEVRLVTVGQLADRLVAIVWTPRDGQVRVISMRRARREEAGEYRKLHG